MDITVIQVRRATRDALARFKIDRGLSTYDAAIQTLIKEAATPK